MDPKCMYCTENEKLQSLMIPIADLQVSRLYLFRDQTYYGRCVLAYKGHVDQFSEVPGEDLLPLAQDVQTAQNAIRKATGTYKINLGCFGDTMVPPHFHFHLVPKKEGDPGFGGTFSMNFDPPRHLAEEEYAALIEKIRSAL